MPRIHVQLFLYSDTFPLSSVISSPVLAKARTLQQTAGRLGHPEGGRPGEVFAPLVMAGRVPAIHPPPLNRVGRLLAEPPSHTTWHTDRVPRWFPTRFNAAWCCLRLMRPIASNQAFGMA